MRQLETECHTLSTVCVIAQIKAFEVGVVSFTGSFAHEQHLDFSTRCSTLESPLTIPIQQSDSSSVPDDMKSTRILIIEDNRILREGLKAMINAQPGMKVAETIGSGNNIVERVRSRKPNVVLFDMSLKNLGDLSIVKLLTQNFPESRIIGMGLIPTQSDIVEFVKAGASGFILKDASVKDFVKTIRDVALGSKVLPPQFTGSLFAHVVEQAMKKGKRHLARAVSMTKREREILVFIAEGLSNKEIAERLNLAVYTVKSHIHNIMEKLALHSRLQIAKYTRDEEDSLG